MSSIFSYQRVDDIMLLTPKKQQMNKRYNSKCILSKSILARILFGLINSSCPLIKTTPSLIFQPLLTANCSNSFSSNEIEVVMRIDDKLQYAFTNWKQYYITFRLYHYVVCTLAIT